MAARAKKKTSPVTATPRTRPQAQPLTLSSFYPKTENQMLAKQYWDDGLNLMLHGVAGTGKTYLALAFALEAVMADQRQASVRLFRSTVSSRDQGHLPGDVNEKAAVYESPYYGNMSKLFGGRPEAYDTLKRLGMVDFTTTSYLRGETWDDTVFVIDEAQNMSFHELDTILTRRGDNCRVIIAGDFRQCDLGRFEKTGINQLMRILSDVDTYASVEFGVDDIVRSKDARDYILAKLKHDLV